MVDYRKPANGPEATSADPAAKPVNGASPAAYKLGTHGEGWQLVARIILISGKGGVGKTTVAAATALASARRGYRTLVMSLDIAHSLSDSFDQDGSLFDQHRGLPVPVGERLDLQEIDVQEEVERYWGDVYRYLALVFSTTGLSNVVAEELAIIPGMEDVIALLYLNQYVGQDTYDVIVLDCAPTGESLRFVSMPTTLEWYMRKLFRFERSVARVARPVVKAVADIPLPDDRYFAAIERLFARLEGVEKVLVDPATTSVRLVTNAEKMVVRESQRAYMYFSMYGMITDQVIINRLFPESEGYFAQWARTQARHAAQITEYFHPVPVARLPLFADEVIGRVRLEEAAARLYGDSDPTQFYLNAPPYAFAKENGGYRLEMNLPFVQKNEIDITRETDDLVVRVGSFKRHVPLPRTVARLRTGSARMDGTRLRIQFVEEKKS
jgi:arsenite-transporting ATPase